MDQFHSLYTVIVILNIFGQINCNPIHGGAPAGETFSSGGKYFIENNGEYPYVAQLERKSIGKYLCGSMIIKPQFVLTAAHCVYDQIAENLSVRAGTFLVGDSTNNYVQIRDVEGFQFPSQFIKDNKLLLDHDIAVLKLKKSFATGNRYVDVIQLPSKNMIGKFSDKKMKVLGFGETENHSKSIFLQHANMNIISDAMCAMKGNIHSKILICALGSEHDVGLKCGDSGGGIVQHFKGKPSKDLLLGISTFMVCKLDLSFSPDLPSIFVEVAYYSSWIEKVMREM